MVTKGCFNVASLLFRQKSIKSRKTGKSGNSKKMEDPALQMQQKKVKRINIKRINTGCTYGPPDKSSLVMELRKKIMTLRYILDFPPCDGFASLNEIIIDTTTEVQKLFPEIIPISLLLEIKGASIDEGLVYFCKALKSVRELWMISHEWIDEVEFDTNFDDLNIKSEQLVENVLATLDSIISIARKKFDVVDEADEEDYSPQSSTSRSVLSESYSESNSSCCSTPITPTSVLPEPKKYSSKSLMRSPLLSPLRVQAVVKLNPIDLKRLSFHMFPHVENQESDILKQTHQRVEQTMSQEENASKSIVVNETCNFNKEKGMLEDLKSDLNIRAIELEENEVEALTTPSEITPTNLFAQALDDLPSSSSSPHLSKNIEPIIPTQYEPKSVVPSSVSVAAETPPLLPTLSSPMILEAFTSTPSPVLTSIPVLSKTKKEVTPPPPPPPPPSASMIATSSQSKAFKCTPKVPPLPPTLSGSKTAPPAPPPPGTTKTLPIASTPPLGTSPPPPPPPLARSPPPPPMQLRNGAAPPPPPPGGGATSFRPGLPKTKLKRSSQLGNLYRLLKRKVEGTSPRVASSEKRTKVGGSASTSGKQGMADALAEMTKRSAYFQQIEEDVQKYAKSIKELKVAISSFQTKDMSELLKFHKDVESVLEKLTDETQVLARFEDFPAKKLETLRTAASLYSRLDATISELHNWKIEAPLGKLLDKVERYFNKIKVDLDAMERTKDEEAKKFKNHNIHFDFGILIKIKEAIVDLSSGCMELALKERRELKQVEETGKSGTLNKGSATGLWRAFQLAFRVYTFAGGHDDRADQLTRELAREIETDPQDQ